MKLIEAEIIRRLFHDTAPGPFATLLSELRPNGPSGVAGISRLDAWDAMVEYIREEEERREREDKTP